MSRDPYERPELYELAFAWRDYGQAIDFLTEASRQAGLTNIKSMVELGCGPAQYAREFARRGVEAFGVDLAPEMALYAQNIFDNESLPGYILEADTRDFNLEHPVNLAVCMMATFGLMLTNDDIVNHFRAVARNLTLGGLYIIELPHPRDVFNLESSTKNVWEMEKDGGKLSIDWASETDFDPITEITTGEVHLTWEHDGTIDEHVAPERFREYGLGVLKALIEISGGLELATIYGDIKVDVPFDNTKKSWRMVLVLRKK
jgi:SAM-dependent methyltransferase